MVSRRLLGAPGGRVVAALLLLAACGDDMARQPGGGADEPVSATAEPIPPGTVPRGRLEREARLASPPEQPLDLATLRRGRDGFEAFCSPCHGRTGDGDGMVVRHGFPPPPSFHTEALRDVTREHVVGVITNGRGIMFPYANRVEPDDRWAIAAYIKALQLSQGVPVADLPEEDRAMLPEPGG
jgi:mono/diheme cytochrome c family protein